MFTGSFIELLPLGPQKMLNKRTDTSQVLRTSRRTEERKKNPGTTVYGRACGRTDDQLASFRSCSRGFTRVLQPKFAREIVLLLNTAGSRLSALGDKFLIEAAIVISHHKVI